MKRILTICILSLYIVIPLSVDAQLSYYVDPVKGSDAYNGLSIDRPFKTINRARDIVRTVNKNMTGDIMVYLRGGVYKLNSTFRLLSPDGGTHQYNIVYQPYNCEKPILSGGVKVGGWVLYDAARNIYKASVDPALDSRQLYVNGARAIRARSEDAAGWSESGDGYDCPAEVSQWKNISKVEVVSTMIWKCHRGPIASVSGGHATMSQPYWNFLHVQYNAPPAWIENAYELLDAEGEWYLDRTSAASTLYYKPRAGEDMSTAEVYLPRVQTLVSCSGVNNVEFRGIAFEHATWLFPNTANGFACLQADARISGSNENIYTQMPGNIMLNYCSNVIFNSCTFTHLGSTALQLYSGCKNNTLYNNRFIDISGSAISIGNLNDSFPSPENLIKDNTADNNFIARTALEYKGCVGILVGYTEHTVLLHNEMHGMPYTGISLGWGWSNTVTAAAGNEIAYNLIDSVMTSLEDGAGIYLLSAQPGTQVHHNYIRNEMNEGAALYADEGSSYMRIHHNVVNKAVRWVNLWSTTSLQDTVDFNYYNADVMIFSGTGCIMADNQSVTDEHWPSEAAYIMNSAGNIKVASCNYEIPPPNELAGLVITMYPSPTRDLLHISLEKRLVQDYKILVYDFQGQLLQTQYRSRTQLFSDVDLSRYAAGMYLVRINSGGFNFARKIFKQ